MKKRVRTFIGTLICIICVALVVWIVYRSNFSTNVNVQGDKEHVESLDPEIFQSVANGEIDAVKTAIQNGTDVNIKHPRNKRSLLHFAIYYQQDEVALFLIEKGIKCDDVDIYQTTPLMLAVLNGSFTEYEMLRDRANVLVNDMQGNTLLHFAAASGSVAIFNDLVERGLDPLQTNVAGNPVICYASSKEMLENIMYVTETDEISLDVAKKILFCAQSPEIVEYLTENEAIDINALDNEQRNALFYAVQNNLAEVFQALIDKGINVNQQDVNGNTMLHICAMDGAEEYVCALLSAGADKDKNNNENNTPYDLAVFYQNTTIADILGGKK